MNWILEGNWPFSSHAHIPTMTMMMMKMIKEVSMAAVTAAVDGQHYIWCSCAMLLYVPTGG